MMNVNIIKCVSGHFRRDKTLAKIAERYYWKGMKHTINDYTQTCTKGFTVKAKISTEALLLHPIPVPTKVRGLIGIDIIGPLQETVSGNKYIVAATDHFSKWSEVAAIPNKSASSVAQFLYYAICRLGCMVTSISDQGREFVNKLINKLTVRFDTDHHISSAYHRQSNGQRERDNRTLKDTWAKLVNGYCNNWDTFIAGVLFAYHTSVHSSTKHTPFEIMYGHKAELPQDNWPPADTSDEDDSSRDVNQETLQCLVDIRQSLQSSVADNIQAAQNRQK